MLILGAAAGSAALAAGCSRIAPNLAADGLPAAIEPPKGPTDPNVRLMNRVGFGPRPGDPAAVATRGRERWIEEQLAPTEEDELSHQLQIRNLEAFRTSSAELMDLHKETIVIQLQQAAILRAVYSRWQLRERLADFWSNHFNIYALKGDGAFALSADQAAVVRRHALGRFPDLLRASAHSPAMLAYLDNQVNRNGVANENYARELMELHTLGVDGGYSQRDVQEVARCFTGWTVETRFLRPRGRFRFDADAHDDGAKSVLGHAIPAGAGESAGERVLEILAAHPSTARHLARKLCGHFLGEAPDALMATVAGEYARTGGDIPSMLRPILRSPLLIDGPPVAKRPFDYLASALRALAARTDGGRPLQEHLEKMGQPLYQWPMPDGYPDRTSAWTGSLLARWNFALALCTGGIAGTSVPLASLAERMGVAPEQAVRDLAAPGVELAALRGRSAAEAAALCLAAPEFQWR